MGPCCSEDELIDGVRPFPKGSQLTLHHTPAPRKSLRQHCSAVLAADIELTDVVVAVRLNVLSSEMLLCTDA